MAIKNGIAGLNNKQFKSVKCVVRKDILEEKA